jgi:hypothetical protein
MRDNRRKIRQLRAKAASTTFPHERDALTAKADELEKKLGTEPPAPPPPSYASTAPQLSEDERRQNYVREVMRKMGMMHGYTGGGDPLNNPHFAVRERGAPVMPAPSTAPLPGEAKKIR